MTTPTADRLLHLDTCDVRSLVWLRNRAHFWQYALKRRRKYSVRRGAEFSEAEMLTFEALRNLEDAAALLLELSPKCDTEENGSKE